MDSSGGNSRPYKLSPSDFKYLWEDCKHCYWRKVRQGIYLPSIGMPGIFGKMNNLLQETLIGRNLNELHPDLPSGTFEKKEAFLKSAPIPNSGRAYVSGRLDLLTTFEDGTHGIIDLKITDPRSENLYKFSTQLHAYKFALENPADDQERIVNKISTIGLLIVSPEEVELTNGKVAFHTTPQWIPIEEDMGGFFSFIDRITEFLDQPMPEASNTCEWCKYRALTGNGISHKEEQNLPF